MIMKTCSRCQENKTLDNYTKNNTRTDKLNSACKDCHKEYTRKHYQQNKKCYKDKARVNRKKLKKVNKMIIYSAKDVPCTDCARRFPPCAMDFDHIKGEKVANVSQMVNRKTQDLVDEIAKCEVVCSICHRIRTHNRRVSATKQINLCWWIQTRPYEGWCERSIRSRGATDQ